MIKGFSKKYKLIKLVYFEEFYNINDAIIREKQLKNWHRDWKLNLIKKNNPLLKDLSINWDEGDADPAKRDGMTFCFFCIAKVCDSDLRVLSS